MFKSRFTLLLISSIVINRFLSPKKEPKDKRFKAYYLGAEWSTSKEKTTSEKSPIFTFTNKFAIPS